MQKSIRSVGNSYRFFSNLVREQSYYFEREGIYGAHNYKPMPVVLKKGRGVYVWDTEGKQYLDFLSAYSAVNQGHCHPRLLKVLQKQAKELTLTSRAFYNNKLGEYQEFMCKTFNYDKLLPMNTGVEAAETSVKLARRWAYAVKGVPENQATILFPRGNFWGRSIGAISASSDPTSYSNFGPYVPNFDKIEYNNINALEEKLSSNPYIAAYMMEPIQGEAGVIIPSLGYLKKVRELCDKYNVLMICDEIQTGLGRTGMLLASNYENVKPDILVLGKALSGGIMPVSAVLSSNEVMLTIKPGEHGSTYGGNPLGSALAVEAIKIILDEKLSLNSFNMGYKLKTGLKEIQENKQIIKDVRGKGLMMAIEINDDKNKNIADSICKKMLLNGLLAKTTHKTVIRLSPPLTINEKQINKALDIIKKSLREY